MVDKYYYTFIPNQRMYNTKMNLNVNHGLWVIMMCQCINCNKHTTLVSAVDSGRGYACVGVGSIWETLYLSAQYYCEPTATVKKKLRIFKTNKQTKTNRPWSIGLIRPVVAVWLYYRA